MSIGNIKKNAFFLKMTSDEKGMRSEERGNIIELAVVGGKRGRIVGRARRGNQSHQLSWWYAPAI